MTEDSTKTNKTKWNKHESKVIYYFTQREIYPKPSLTLEQFT